jgi:hypothetical protein
VAATLDKAKFGLGCLLVAGVVRFVFFKGSGQCGWPDPFVLVGGLMLILVAWGFSRLLR